jgi:hypothetical protein
MTPSLSDLMRGMIRGNPERKSESRYLRGALWLSHAILTSQLSPDEFAAQYIERRAPAKREDESTASARSQASRTRSRLARKWLKGRHHPALNSAKAVERLLKGTLWVFQLPLAELLRDRPLGARTIRQLAAPYLNFGLHNPLWVFPGDDELFRRRHYRMAFAFSGWTGNLVARGDLWGFLGVLFEVRMQEALSNQGAHLQACRDMYRALPNVLKLPWVAPHEEALFSACERVRRRSEYSFMMFDVDRETIRSQTADPEQEPMRECRKRDPRTLRFLDVADPTLPAQIIRGRYVRDQERRRHERNARQKENRERAREALAAEMARSSGAASASMPQQSTRQRRIP